MLTLLYTTFVKIFVEKDRKLPEKSFKETVGNQKEAVKITDFTPPAKMQELTGAAGKSKVPLLPLPSDARLGVVDSMRSKPDEVPIRSFYRPPTTERPHSGPDPGRISIRNALRETLLNRQDTDNYTAC